MFGGRVVRLSMSVRGAVRLLIEGSISALVLAQTVDVEFPGGKKTKASAGEAFKEVAKRYAFCELKARTLVCTYTCMHP
jgi:hypothetical protein